MIVYNTKDIVKRAKMLADLQNSDFITYEENVTLLNDAYTQLYQKAIDVNDKIYLKTLDLTPAQESTTGVSTYCLPDDFYQLYSVQQINNLSVVPILRRSKNSPMNGVSYDIIENKLYIYGAVIGNVRIEYFPILETLTLEREPFKLKELNITGKSLSISESKVLVQDDSDKTFKVYDIHTGDIVKTIDYASIALESEIDNVIGRVYEDGLLITFDKGKVHYVAKGRFRDTIGIVNHSENNITYYPKTIIEDGNKYYDEPEEVLDAEATKFEETITINDIEYKLIVNSRSQSVVLSINGTLIDLSDKISFHSDNIRKNSLAFIDECNVYIILENKSKQFYIYNFETEQITKKSLPGVDIISVKGINLSTGYGYLVHRDDNIGELISCFENSELDYPNNFYFSYIAYMLAISYKLKQGADPSFIAMKAQGEMETYFDTLKRDGNMPVRITNAYNY